ncbi:ATP-binding protein [Streptomyces mirabilis]|uniref:ATP-binding protein n=1 Tax=Streptomyces mirabilis TaxID=68239 RepID=UPI0033D1ACA5
MVRPRPARQPHPKARNGHHVTYRPLTKHTDHCQQNKSVVRWGEVFGDDTVAAAMIDRLVHHADVLSLKGDSYRLKDRDIGRTPSAATG